MDIKTRKIKGAAAVDAASWTALKCSMDILCKINKGAR